MQEEDLVTVQYQFWELSGTWSLRTEEPGLGLKAPVRPFKSPGHRVKLAASWDGCGSKPSDLLGTGPVWRPATQLLGRDRVRGGPAHSHLYFDLSSNIWA